MTMMAMVQGTLPVRPAALGATTRITAFRKRVKKYLVGNWGDPDPCETEDELINSIESTMKDLMEKSYHFDKYQRKEQGGYLYKNSPDGEVKFKPFPDSFERTPCGINFTPDEFIAHMPDGTVGYIHTHPWSKGEMQWSCTTANKEMVEMWGDEMAPAYDDWIYEPGPSEDDVLMAQAFKNAGLNIDGYLIDQDNIYTFDETASPKDLSTLLNEFERCGY